MIGKNGSLLFKFNEVFCAKAWNWKCSKIIINLQKWINAFTIFKRLKGFKAKRLKNYLLSAKSICLKIYWNIVCNSFKATLDQFFLNFQSILWSGFKKRLTNNLWFTDVDHFFFKFIEVFWATASRQKGVKIIFDLQRWVTSFKFVEVFCKIFKKQKKETNLSLIGKGGSLLFKFTEVHKIFKPKKTQQLSLICKSGSFIFKLIEVFWTTIILNLQKWIWRKNYYWSILHNSFKA